MLRKHYNPHTGHRFDYVRALDAELAELDRVRSNIMEHALFVNIDGERKFNLRAVDYRLRASKAYTDTLKAKVVALRLQATDATVDATSVLDAISTSSTMIESTHKRRRRADDAGGAMPKLYDLVGM